MFGHPGVGVPGASSGAEAGVAKAKLEAGKCALCGESIGELAVLAMGRLWHPLHFRCQACETPLSGYFLVDGICPLCPQCFMSKFTPRCHGCGEALLDSCWVALEKHWHPQCFKCSRCGQPLRQGEHYVVDGLPYDGDCYWCRQVQLHSLNDEPIDDAVSHVYHLHGLGDR